MFIVGHITHEPGESQDTPAYLAAIPMLGLMTQGSSLIDAYDMVKDLLKETFIEERMDVPFNTGWLNESQGIFTVDCPSDLFPALILKRLRLKVGLTQTQLAERIGAKYANAIAAYESGDRLPTLKKFNEILEQLNVPVGLTTMDSTTKLLELPKSLV